MNAGFTVKRTATVAAVQIRRAAAFGRVVIDTDVGIRTTRPAWITEVLSCRDGITTVAAVERCAAAAMDP